MLEKKVSMVHMNKWVIFSFGIMDQTITWYNIQTWENNSNCQRCIPIARPSKFSWWKDARSFSIQWWL